MWPTPSTWAEYHPTASEECQTYLQNVPKPLLPPDHWRRDVARFLPPPGSRSTWTPRAALFYASPNPRPQNCSSAAKQKMKISRVYPYSKPSQPMINRPDVVGTAPKPRIKNDNRLSFNICYCIIFLFILPLTVSWIFFGAPLLIATQLITLLILYRFTCFHSEFDKCITFRVYFGSFIYVIPYIHWRGIE